MDSMGAVAAVHGEGLPAQGETQSTLGSILCGAQSACLVAGEKKVSKRSDNFDVREFGKSVIRRWRRG